MSTRLRKIIQILTALFIVINTVQSTGYAIFTASTVYAQDDEESEETEEDGEEEEEDDGGGATITSNNQNANAYAFGNALAADGFKSAATYDPVVHYITTYTTLQSKYTDSKNDSPYSKVYRGNNGGALEGVIGEAVKSQNGEVKTDAVAYVKGLMKSKKEQEAGADHDGDGTQSAGEGSDTSVSDDDQAGRDAVGEQVTAAENAYTEQLTDLLMGAIDGNLTPNTVDADRVMIDSSNSYRVKGRGFFTGNTRLVGIRSPNSYKKLSSSAYTKYKAALSIAVSSKVRTGTLRDGELSDENIRGILKDAHGIIESDNINSDNIESFGKVLGLVRITNANVGILPQVEPVGEGAKQRFLNGDSTMVVSIIDTALYSGQEQKYKDLLSMMVYEVYAKVHPDELKNFNTAIEGVRAALKRSQVLLEYQEVKTDNAVTNDGYKLLTWTNLVPKLISTLEDDKEFTKTLDALDGTSVEGDRMIKDGEDRLLEIGDLFMSKTKFSPVLVGSNVSTTQHVSSLYVGDTNTGFSTDAEPVNKSIGSRNSGTLNSDSTYIPGQNQTVGETRADWLKEAGGVRPGQMPLKVATAHPEGWGAQFVANNVAKSSTVGIDGYGNIINGENGSVVLPYWQNSMFSDLHGTQHGGEMYMSSPMFTVKTEVDYLKTLFESAITIPAKEGNTPQRLDKIIGSRGSGGEVAAILNKVRAGFPSTLTVDTFNRNLTNGVQGVGKDETLRAVALIITAYTTDMVKDYNAKYVQAAADSERMYLLTGNDQIDGLKDGSDDPEFRWTAASLIQKIGDIMDFGFFETIRLTVSRAVSNFYRTTIQNAGLTQIFYTPNIMTGIGDSWILVLISSVVALVLTIYILIMAFRMWRGTGTLKQLVVKFIMLTLVVVIPSMIYGPLTEFVLNKPSQMVLNNQMKATSILDTYLIQDEDAFETNEYYQRMFGREAGDVDLVLGSYNMRFYTTTDKAGFDINLVSENDEFLTTQQRKRVKEYQVDGIEYPTRHLVSVDVAMTDLYKWVWDIRNRGESSENASEHEGFPIYEQAISDGYTKHLFEWLAGGGSQYQKVVGYESELATYTEYRVDLVKPLMVKDADFRATWEMVYGGDEMTQGPVADDGTPVEKVMEQYKVTGSELFYDIVRNSSEGNVPTNLSKLSDMSNMINYTTVEPNAKTYIPTTNDIQSLVRDLSMTASRRKALYAPDSFAPFTRAVMEVEDPYILTDFAGNDLELAINPRLVEPKQDFLDLYAIVSRLTPNRTSDYISPYYKSKNKTIHGDVYDINHNLLMNYLTTYSVTRASLGDKRNSETLAHSEQMVMVTEAFFQFNDVLNLKHFPVGYHVGSITFDKYLTLIYVPFKDYATATLNFFESGPVVPRTTAEAVVLKSDLISLLLFLLVLIALIIFGYTYVAVFHGLFLVVMCYSYIKNYVIKQDYDNKSWLGTIMVYGGFGLAKLGLVSIWWAMSHYLNSSIAKHPEMKAPYDPVFIHSILVIAYVLIAFIAIILPIGKAVLRDPDNMGGQVFADALGKVKGKFDGVSNAIMGGNKSGDSVKNARKNEGSKGKSHNPNNFMPSKDIQHLQAAAQRLDVPLNSLGPQAQASAVQAVNNKVASQGGKLNKNHNTYKASVGVPDTLVTLNKGTAKNKVESALLLTNLARLNRIDSTVGGVEDKILLSAEHGQILTTMDESQVSSYDMGSSEAAEVVVDSLVGRGLNARSLGNMVYLDSTEYDLNNSSVRAELFRPTVQSLQDQYSAKSVTVKDSKIRFKHNRPQMYRVGSEGQVSVFFGDEGLDGTRYDSLFKSKEFRDNFVQPTITDSMIDSQGNMSGWVDLTPNDPRSDVSELQTNVESVFSEDDKLRKRNKVGTRQVSDYTHRYSMSNLTEEARTHVETVAAHNNMLVQGDSVYYRNTRGHKNGISQLDSYFETHNNDLGESYLNPSKNLTSYVVKNGENQGVVNETFKASESVEGTDLLYGTEPLRRNISKVKVDFSREADILKTYDTMHNLQEFSRTRKDDILSYQQTKEQVNRTAFDSLVKENGRGVVDSTIYAEEAENYLNRSSIKSSRAYKELRQERHKLNELRDSQKISEVDYHKKNLEYTEGYRSLLEDAGMLDEFSLGIVKSKDSKLHADYFDKRKTVATGANTDEVELSRIRGKDLLTNSKLVTDKQGLRVENGVATISYSEDDVNSRVGVNGPTGDTEKFILRTNLDRSYLNTNKEMYNVGKDQPLRTNVPEQDFVVKDSNKELFNSYKERIEQATTVNEVLDISRQIRNEEQDNVINDISQGTSTADDDTYRILKDLAQEKTNMYMFGNDSGESLGKGNAQKDPIKAANDAQKTTEKEVNNAQKTTEKEVNNAQRTVKQGVNTAQRTVKQGVNTAQRTTKKGVDDAKQKSKKGVADKQQNTKKDTITKKTTHTAETNKAIHDATMARDVISKSVTPKQEKAKATKQPEPKLDKVKATPPKVSKLLTENDVSVLYSEISNATTMKQLLEVEDMLKQHSDNNKGLDKKEASRDNSAVTKLLVDINKRKRDFK